LTGIPTRIEKRAGGRSATERDTDSPSVAGEKTVWLDKLHEYSRGSYDLRGCMGDVLRSRCNFTTLAGIRAAYSVAFSDKEKRARTEQIDAALSDRGLDALCIVRNVIVHRAGIADDKYVTDLAIAPGAPKVRTGESLKLDGAQVKSLVEPVIRSARKLLRAADVWLTLTGKGNAGN
jgi:hypothetical protein